MLPLYEKCLYGFHVLLVGFNMVGWAWRKTRVLHLIVLGLTAFSWFVMGAYHGWGYCLCTDWHFRVRRQLGYPVPESSFIQLLSRDALGVNLPRRSSDILAVSVFAAIVIATAVVWTLEVRTWMRRRIATTGDEPKLSG